jgi:hypothetical protein
MSKSSSPKKNSITSSDEYDRLDEYEKTYLGAKDESDEDYLSKFDDR